MFGITLQEFMSLFGLIDKKEGHEALTGVAFSQEMLEGFKAELAANGGRYPRRSLRFSRPNDCNSDLRSVFVLAIEETKDIRDLPLFDGAITCGRYKLYREESDETRCAVIALV